MAFFRQQQMRLLVDDFFCAKKDEKEKDFLFNIINFEIKLAIVWQKESDSMFQSQNFIQTDVFWLIWQFTFSHKRQATKY